MRIMKGCFLIIKIDFENAKLCGNIIRSLITRVCREKQLTLEANRLILKNCALSVITRVGALVRPRF